MSLEPVVVACSSNSAHVPHRPGCLSGEVPDAYSPTLVQDILNELEKSISDRELLEVVAAERDDLPYVKASVNRLLKDDYERINVGDYKEKARNRTTTQARQRKKYEVFFLSLFGSITSARHMRPVSACCLI